MAPTDVLISHGSGGHCPVCRNLDYHCPLPEVDIEAPSDRPCDYFSRRFSEFQISADQGCPICWVLASLCRSWGSTTVSARRLHVEPKADGKVVLGCSIWKSSPPDLCIYIPGDNSSYIPVEKTSLFGSIPVKADISDSPWSVSAQKFAIDCIQACIEDHELCGLGESVLPTRVIDVGNIGDEQLRLYETQRTITGWYTALSYCWGSGQQLQTTSENMKDMMSGLLKLSQLPQTLADAVHVTRSLGVQYLWVDALCIMQDHVEDWERESAQMSSIYEKAYLVIAASSSSSATQGFLNHKRQQPSYHFNIPKTYGTHPPVAAHAIIQSGFHDRTKKTDPLSQRAWAFQEQHMATRCLLFSTDELQWVCKTKAACECGVPVKKGPHQPLLLPYHDDTQQKGDEAGDQLALQDLWRKVVSEYSCRKLTRPDDKLPAVSGLASRFEARMGLRYVAGLWEQNIIQDLAWTRESWLEHQPLPVDYRAPSFSWASINDSVHYEYFGAHHKKWHWISCSLLCEARAVVPGRNPYGKMRDAWITIRGPTARGTIEGGYGYPRFCSDDREIDMYMRLDCALTEFSYATQGGAGERSVRRCRCLAANEESAREGLMDRDEPVYVVEPGAEDEPIHSHSTWASVWLLHLGRWSKYRAGSQVISGEENDDFYLVLGKSARDPQKYERIGSCNTWSAKLLAERGEGFTTRTITIL